MLPPVNSLFHFEFILPSSGGLIQALMLTSVSLHPKRLKSLYFQANGPVKADGEKKRVAYLVPQELGLLPKSSCKQCLQEHLGSNIFFKTKRWISLQLAKKLSRVCFLKQRQSVQQFIETPGGVGKILLDFTHRRLEARFLQNVPFNSLQTGLSWQLQAAYLS